MGANPAHLSFAQRVYQVLAQGYIRRSFAILRLLAAVADLICSRAAPAQTDRAEAKDASPLVPERQVVTAPVVIDRRRVMFQVRAVTAFPAADRAATMAQRIRAIAEDRATSPTVLRLVGNEQWTEIVAFPDLSGRQWSRRP